ncbi:hypothetical protein [Lactobacillus crispatus]|uniref:hypothetical protein n=1 Tax=Lactobacillus crispatus TaxID=47770 RepID=UPI0030F73633
MEIIDKTASNKKEYSLGKTFKLVTTRTNSLVDVLMVCQDAKSKYYFVSLADDSTAGSLYGWGNGNPANTIKELFEQVIDPDYNLKPVKASLTITEE